MIKKNTTQVMVGDVAVGGGAPIVIQSMTNTHTFNKKETVAKYWSSGALAQRSSESQ
jgi:(E)-4-hydroxy-3-methylbut-2-enyl-diphosphate synthase